MAAEVEESLEGYTPIPEDGCLISLAPLRDPSLRCTSLRVTDYGALPW
jgi:hypothetical protein